MIKQPLIPFLAIISLLALPVYANAQIETSTTTSDFTVEIVENSLGLTISGNTNLGKIPRASTPELIFPGLKVTNHGDVKGYLYAEVGNLSGISFGNSEGDLMTVSVAEGVKELSSISQTEKLLTEVMREMDSDGDPDGISPSEELKTFAVIFSVKDRLPAGQLSMPIKWTLKPQ